MGEESIYNWRLSSVIWEEIWIPVNSAAWKLHYFGFWWNLTICIKDWKNLYFCSLSGLGNCIFGIENPVNRAIGNCHQIPATTQICFKTPIFVAFSRCDPIGRGDWFKINMLWVPMGRLEIIPIFSPKTPILTKISPKPWRIALLGLHFCTMPGLANYKGLHNNKGFLYKVNLCLGLVPSHRRDFRV